MSKTVSFVADASVKTPKGLGTVHAPAAKGWIPVELEDGSIHNFRASALKIVGAASDGTRIKPDWDKLTKVQAASGKRSFDNADSVAKKLRGKTLEEVADIASAMLVEEGEGMTAKALLAKYSHLNPGHQRMCIGNKVRAAIKRGEDGVIRNS
jgi:hypothetical protein